MPNGCVLTQLAPSRFCWDLDLSMQGSGIISILSMKFATYNAMVLYYSGMGRILSMDCFIFDNMVL